ncbi:hypothetical protein G6F56_003628 [Rhizopus delemar]|nr:hypothetical protein G6F56_003628 [Rhizopus delemar]
MSSETPNDVQIVQALSEIVTQNRYAAMQTMRIIYNYESGTNIELWLRLFEAKANRLGLHSGIKIDILPSYLPVNMAQWILSNPALDTWTKIKEALVQTFGIPIAQQKQTCRAKLESLHQGTIPSRQFKASFESIVQELPEDVSLPVEVLRSIYMRVMNPRLLDKIIGQITTSSTWDEVADKAVTMDEILNADSRLAAAQLYSAADMPSTGSSFIPPAAGPTPMEIDAFHRKPQNSYQRQSTPQSNNRNKFNQWARPGVPICGHCNKEGHLSKRCRFAKNYNNNNNNHQGSTNNRIHAIQDSTAPVGPSNDYTSNAAPEVLSNPVSWSSYGSAPVDSFGSTPASVNYAYVPEPQDPRLIANAASNIAKEAIHSLTYLSQPVLHKGSQYKCSINGTPTTCLSDTGATISAIRTTLVSDLGLSVDPSKKLTFTTAAGAEATTLGVTMVLILLGEIPLHLECHVVDNLAHPIIIGYNDLQANKAIIDTGAGTIYFPGIPGPSSIVSSGSAGLASGSSTSTYTIQASTRFNEQPTACVMDQSLRLPAHHHAYVQIQGPRDALAMVTTPSTLSLEKLIAVASGVVQFDQEGLATIKIANLNLEDCFLNKHQIVAYAEYLPSSFPTVRLSETIASVSHRTPSRPLDFKPTLGSSLTPDQTSQMVQLLENFTDCFDSSPTSTTPLVQHHIDTENEKPISSAPHRASAAENETINGLIDEMLQQGIIQPSRSPWSSPVVLVPKPDDTVRFCVDYRRLNTKTTKDVHPLTRIDDALHSLGNAKYFSTMDLTSSYWQIELDDESKPKSAFVCRRGLYEFVRMPFGLCSAPSTMQRLMDSVLAGLKWQTALVYLDDIICYSASFEQHLQDLREILLRLREASLKIKLSKCCFGSNRISFLGYVLSPDGLHTDPEKVRAVASFPVPTSAETLRSFLGLAGYYRSFISQFSVLAAPLHALLCADAPWVWSTKEQEAYDTLKTALLTAPVLRYPDFSRPFELHTDGACSAGIGVILCQRDPRNRRAYAIAYASRSLTPAERNYGVSEVEALAIVWGIRKFAHYLTGTKFEVVTDHHSLQFLQSTRSSDLRGRLARWALTLQQHDFTIRYRPGSQNAGPDALSRYPAASSPGSSLVCSLTASDLVTAQATDPYCKEIRCSDPLPSGFTDESGVLFFGSRPVLPASQHNHAFDLLHANPTTGHLGVSRTVQRFSRLFYFPNLYEWVKKRVNSCEVCQRVKNPNVTLGHTKLKHSDTTVHPFDTIAIDTFGPLPLSRSGNKYIVVIQCLFSRYVILTAVPENNDFWITRCLLKTFAEHGIVRSILSDNGKPYSGLLLKKLADHLNINQKFTPAYHPQSNGLVERFMASLRNFIVSFMDLNTHQVTWDEHLNEFQLAYNSSIHESTKFSPFSIVHGREARVLVSPDFGGVKTIPHVEYTQQTKDYLSRAYATIQLENLQSQAKNALTYNEQRKQPAIRVGDIVLVDFPVHSSSASGRAAKLVRSWRGPFKVVTILSPDRFDVLEIATSKTWKNIHAARMKKYEERNEDITSIKTPGCCETTSSS